MQPTVRAGSGEGYSAFWVGLGGSSSSSTSLEQVGTEADWVDGHATYIAWYELVPRASVRLALTIHAGDRIAARVTVSATTVTVLLADRTTGASVTRTLHMSHPDTSCAEWMAEAPSSATPGGYRTLPLADFGTVTFSGASATAGAHSGPVSDAAWTAERVQLTSAGQGGPGGASPSRAREAREPRRCAPRARASRCAGTTDRGRRSENVFQNGWHARIWPGWRRWIEARRLAGTTGTCCGTMRRPT